METQILEAVGLTKSEIAVYLALLELGPSSTGPIIKESKIASGKAYLILDKLINKGLVTYAITSGIKKYHAKDPNRLLDYLQERKSQLDEVEKELKGSLPQLIEQFESKKNITTAEVYEGIQGFKTFHKFMLDVMKAGETIYVWGVPKEANEKFGGHYIEWNKERVKRGIKLKILYNADSKKYGEERKNLPLTEVRYMGKDEITPAWVDVFGEYIATVNVHNKPVCFLIKNEGTRQSYLQYFELLWSKAEK